MSDPLPDAAVRRLRDRLAIPPVVAGRYAIEGLAGRGGMGEVYRATDARLGRTVALKVIAAERSAGTAGARIEHEARILARLEHPGIVPVHDAGTLDDGRAWYVMRFVEGSSLDAIVRAGAGRGELLRIVLRIAEAMAFAHGQGILHRDLKPGNVMVGPFGEVLVLDWGIAQMLAPPAATGPGAPDGHAAGAPAGTPGYMAPEQASGALPLDERADVFSLGVLLRDLLVHDGTPVPRPLGSIIRRATEPDRAARYPTALALAEDLRRWLDGEAVLAHREGMAERLWRFARRHQVALLLLVAYVVIRTVILLWRGI